MTLSIVSFQILCSIILSCTDIAAAQGISSLLSRLYNNAAQNNRPLVLIIDKSHLREEPKHSVPQAQPNDLLGTSLESEEDIRPAVYLIQSQVPQSQKRLPTASDLGHNLYGEAFNRPRARFVKPRDRDQMKVVGRTTPSPVLKTLLRYKNEINCEANNECNQKCQDNFSGKKRLSCKVKCEVTFECIPEREPEHPQGLEPYDPCEEDDFECGSEDKNPSTRGVILVTEKPECVRC